MWRHLQTSGSVISDGEEIVHHQITRGTRENNIKASEICLGSGPFTAIIGSAGIIETTGKEEEALFKGRREW